MIYLHHANTFEASFCHQLSLKWFHVLYLNEKNNKIEPNKLIKRNWHNSAFAFSAIKILELNLCSCCCSHYSNNVTLQRKCEKNETKNCQKKQQKSALIFKRTRWENIGCSHCYRRSLSVAPMRLFYVRM